MDLRMDLSLCLQCSLVERNHVDVEERKTTGCGEEGQEVRYVVTAAVGQARKKRRHADSRMDYVDGLTVTVKGD